MSCGETNNCPPCDIFMGNPTQDCFHLFDVDSFEAERCIYDSALKDIINNYGIRINYYVHSFNLSADDTFYGEALYKPFYGPVEIFMRIDLNEDALTLSRFGFRSDEDITGYLHIDSFYQLMSGYSVYSQNGQRVEPKCGDVFQLVDYGKDRVCPRGGKFYEITEKVDQDVAELNPLMGTYMWRIRGKRFEYSFEPGLSAYSTNTGLVSAGFGELGNDQVFENSFSGILSAVAQDRSPDKSYPADVDEESRQIYDQTNLSNIDIYGQY